MAAPAQYGSISPVRAIAMLFHADRGPVLATPVRSATVRRSPGRPRDLARENEILKVTLGILSEVGFAGLTVDAVVAKAKVSKATIYRRWATKEELAVAAFDQLPLIEIESHGNLEEDILAYVEQYRDFVQTTPLNSVLPALVSEATHNEVLAERLKETVARRRETGIAMIRQAIARGELPANTDPALAQELIIGPMLHRSFFSPENITKDDFRYFARIIIAGFKATAEQPSTPA